MREFNALKDYPTSATKRVVGTRNIEHRITSSYRGREFFDGPRDCGYGGMQYDGRWKSIAKAIVEEYKPNSVLQVNSEKGYLLNDLEALGCEIVGIEPSSYARRHSLHNEHIVSHWIQWPQKFDLVIAIGAVYTLNLPDAMECLRRIEATGFNAFVTLAAYDTPDDYWLMREWSLLGTTILKRDEWREVLRHVGYTGDYWFVTASSLNLTRE
jgi:hypothetical protein